MKIIDRTLAGLILLSAVSIISCKTQLNYISTEKIAPLEAPFDMPQLERPAFSNAVFDIADFGAKTGKEFNNCNASHLSTPGSLRCSCKYESCILVF